jgi:hypothetical protein
MDTENTYFNWNVSGLFNATETVSEVCLNTADGSEVVCGDATSGITEISAQGITDAGTGTLFLNITKSAAYGNTHTYTDVTIVADVFSFGAGVNNAIYRLLLEETGDNTATFAGTIEYEMLNQININLDATYTNLDTIGSDIDIIIEQDMTDEDSPRVNYLDLGADGVSTQIADQVEAPTHSGVVSLDMDNYKIADTVVITLDDQDMNTDSELIDVYTTNANDLVGAAAATSLATGLVLDITFDDMTWISQTDAACTNEVGTVTGDDGLEATGFTLVETDIASGIFVGSFQVPTTFCDTSTAGTVADPHTIVTTTGTDIEVNYQDFRNSSGESIEVGDGASINANTGSFLLIEQSIQYHMVT